MERIGLFGGTFDPPHLGHLILAEIAYDALALDAVWFVLAADPPHKRDRVITPVAHRLAMLRLAVDDNPDFQISCIDVDRPGPHYTADMIEIAREQRPEAEWYFVMGADSLRDLPTWREPERILAQCTLAVLQRPDVLVDLDALAAQVPTVRDRVVFIDGPSVGLSATSISQRVREGQSIRYLVPGGVRRYIIKNSLYRS